MSAQTASSYTDNTVTLKVETAEDRTIGSIRRVNGFVKIVNMVELITKLDLDANPRNSRKSVVTAEIIETIEETPDLLPFKSKGILLGTSECLPRERHRYALTFNDRKLEGILDGGHNSLAIALFLLKRAGASEAQVRKVKIWSEMKELWGKYLPELEALRRKADDSSLNALVPVEILFPAAANDENSVNEFLSSILFICAARNNNAQLKSETIANKGGVFDSLKDALPAEILENVAWKTNDTGRIDSRFLVALAWIPLGILDMPAGVTALPGNTAYSSKAEAVNRYRALIEHPDISTQSEDGKTYHLNSEAVRSALQLVPDILETYDWLYRNFQTGYNSTGGKFGRIDAVKNENKSKRTKFTPFYHEEITGDDSLVPPAGFMMPLAYSMRALIRKNSDGTVNWNAKPLEFFSNKENFTPIMTSIKGVLELVSFDPQKVGKNEAAYSNTSDRVRTLFLEHIAAQYNR